MRRACRGCVRPPLRVLGLDGGHRRRWPSSPTLLWRGSDAAATAEHHRGTGRRPRGDAGRCRLRGLVGRPATVPAGTVVAERPGAGRLASTACAALDPVTGEEAWHYTPQQRPAVRRRPSPTGWRSRCSAPRPVRRGGRAARRHRGAGLDAQRPASRADVDARPRTDRHRAGQQPDRHRDPRPDRRQHPLAVRAARAAAGSSAPTVGSAGVARAAALRRAPTRCSCGCSTASAATRTGAATSPRPAPPRRLARRRPARRRRGRRPRCRCSRRRRRRAARRAAGARPRRRAGRAQPNRCSGRRRRRRAAPGRRHRLTRWTSGRRLTALDASPRSGCPPCPATRGTDAREPRSTRAGGRRASCRASTGRPAPRSAGPAADGRRPGRRAHRRLGRSSSTRPPTAVARLPVSPAAARPTAARFTGDHGPAWWLRLRRTLAIAPDDLRQLADHDARTASLPRPAPARWPRWTPAARPTRHRAAGRRLHRQQGGLRPAAGAARRRRLPGGRHRPARAVRVARPGRPGRVHRRRAGRRRRRRGPACCARSTGDRCTCSATASAAWSPAPPCWPSPALFTVLHPARLGPAQLTGRRAELLDHLGPAAGGRRGAAGARDARAGGDDRSAGPGGARADPRVLRPPVPGQHRGRAARHGRRDARPSPTGWPSWPRRACRCWSRTAGGRRLVPARAGGHGRGGWAPGTR